MGNLVPAVERAVRVMNAIAAGCGANSLALARQLGISQSSCYRILRTLEHTDWIRKDESGGYAVSNGLLPFVRPFWGVDQAILAARPVLAELAHASGLSAKLSMRQGTGQVTLERAEAPRPIALSSPVGARFPVVQGASGACLLMAAADEDVDDLIRHANDHNLWGGESATVLRTRIAAGRRDGCCENLGTSPRGIDTVSAPVRGSRCALAITLVGLRGDFDGVHLKACRKRLIEAAATISRQLHTPDTMEEV